MSAHSGGNYKYTKQTMDDDDDHKSKTTNVADLIREVKKDFKQKKPNQMMMLFENTCDISKLKKRASFFSHSKTHLIDLNFI